MKPLRPIWLIFGLCLALAVAAMARVGRMALELERAEARARRQAALEENLQLVLWRMDSAMAPLIAEESARPYFAYTSLYPAERAFTCMFAEIEKGDVLVPSPLLTSFAPRIRLHFQYGPDGRLTSPQVPAGNMRDVAETRYLTPEKIELAAQRLDELSRLMTRDTLASALSADEFSSVANPEMGHAFGAYSQSRISNEYMMRSRNAKLAQSIAPAEALPMAARASVSQGPLQAIWIGPALVLARRVRVAEGTFLQGCWLDWDVIRRELVESAADLAPHADLEPVRPNGGQPQARMLASLPVRLVSGPTPDQPDRWWTPIRLSLAIAWACLALAALAAALMLHAALALSERRATFVSAVTHELRTPLTTFRLYTEMLDLGMVQGPDSQQTYHRTLRTEADRLGHLVENVLAFARLERGRSNHAREVLAPSQLLDRVIPRLRYCASRAGMELVVGPGDVQKPVRLDVSLVDQILSNLVDNAVKYARGAADRRIHIDLVAGARYLMITVSDHGPGLDPSMARRLFQPFSKSAHDAAQSAPGVGLGLALSRRLARSMGGDLRLAATSSQGASFALAIPFA